MPDVHTVSRPDQPASPHPAPVKTAPMPAVPSSPSTDDAMTTPVKTQDPAAATSDAEVSNKPSGPFVSLNNPPLPYPKRRSPTDAEADLDAPLTEADQEETALDDLGQSYSDQFADLDSELPLANLDVNIRKAKGGAKRTVVVRRSGNRLVQDRCDLNDSKAREKLVFRIAQKLGLKAGREIEDAIEAMLLRALDAAKARDRGEPDVDAIERLNGLAVLQSSERFMDPGGRAFVDVERPRADGDEELPPVREAVEVRSPRCKNWLRKLAGDAGMPIPHNSELVRVQETLAAEAEFGGVKEVFRRIGHYQTDDGPVAVVDHCRADGKMTEIGLAGRKTVLKSQVRFMRDLSMGELPLPSAKGDLRSSLLGSVDVFVTSERRPRPASTGPGGCRAVSRTGWRLCGTA